jgi:hypothetical protein
MGGKVRARRMSQDKKRYFESMDKNSVYVLIHSPLVGPLTWKLVAEELSRRNLEVVVPKLQDSPDSKEPYWKQHANSVSQALRHISKDTPMTLVAHSGAGPLLPAIREALPNPVHAHVFVDAGLPGAEATRLELMKSEDPDWARQFQEYLEGGGAFPDWSFDDLQEIIPDEALRAKMIAEIQPRRLEFFTEPIPVFAGWPDAPCIYILFSEPYKSAAVQAKASGWPAYEIEAGHFHMLVDAETVTDMIVKSVDKVVD